VETNLYLIKDTFSLPTLLLSPRNRKQDKATEQKTDELRNPVQLAVHQRFAAGSAEHRVFS